MSHIRFAQLADIPALIELGREMHVLSRYASMSFSADKLWRSLEVAIQDKAQCLIVAADSDLPGEALFGGLWAKATSIPFNTEVIVRTDYLFIKTTRRGSPAVMKMLVGLRRWAINRQACELIVSSEIERHRPSKSILRKLGFSSVQVEEQMWLGRSG